jgi:hypothetical protein
MKKIVPVALFVMMLSNSYSQNTRLTEQNTIGWFSTTITPKITSKISGHIEYLWRRDNFVKDWQQSLLRTGVNFKIHPQITLHAGYAWIETYPYGTYPLAAIPKRFPEHRIYEQVVVNSTVGKTSIMHRLRLEQRWLGRFTSTTSDKPERFVYLNRLRYMPRVDVPLSSKIYASIYDEVLIGFGKNVNENVFDQNRVGLMVGYKAKKYFRIEGGFINQIVQLGREINNRNVFQYNSGLIVNSYFNL